MGVKNGSSGDFTDNIVIHCIAIKGMKNNIINLLKKVLAIR